MYHVDVTFIVSIAMAVPLLSQSPNSSTVIVVVLALMLVFTENLISFFVSSVFGPSVIVLADVISPNVFGILSGFSMVSLFIVTVSFAELPIV